MRFRPLGVAAVTALVTLLSPGEARLAASHFCPLGEPFFWFGTQATSASGSGDTIEIAGWDSYYEPEGFFGHSFRFTHRNAHGAVIRTGLWQPTALLVRREFSCAAPPYGHIIGGLLVFRVTLIGADGTTSNGTLTLVSPEGHFAAPEVMTLKVHDWGLVFDRPISAENWITVV